MSSAVQLPPGAGSRCVLGARAAREACAALRQTSRVWQEAEAKLIRQAPAAVALLEDLFVALYDPAAELDPGIDPAYSGNFAFLASLFATREFKALRETTRADAIACAGAALRTVETLWDEATAGQAHRPQSVVQRIRSAFSGREKSPGIDLGLKAADGEAELSLRAARCVRRAQSQLAADRAMRAVWGIAPGVRSAHAFDDVWGLLSEVRRLPGFRELTDALERFQRILRPLASLRGRRGGWEGASRIAGYTWGRDLDRVAPEEMVRLVDPDMAGLFYEAYDRRRLLQHDVRGDRRGEAGPIICCMDVSASMNTLAALERERFLWCKGLGLALLDYARSVRRPYGGLCFSSEADLEEFFFPVEDYDPRRALEMARCDFNGGTHFELPLCRALEHAAGTGAAWTNSQGDVVFIADGQASLRPSFVEEFRRRKAQLGVRLFTVFIDGDHPGLSALSDAVFSVRSERIDSWEEVAESLGRRLRVP